MIAKIAITASTVIGLTLIGGAAQAGPTPRQPANHRVSQAQAHRIAAFAVDKYLIGMLPGPHSFKVSRCTGGPRVWRCPTALGGADTTCTTSIMVWSDKPGRFFVEAAKLRCEG